MCSDKSSCVSRVETRPVWMSVDRLKVDALRLMAGRSGLPCSKTGTLSAREKERMTGSLSVL